ncbi:hypothetical protein KC19_VG258700 [Ceratodon purpureus]|uniref:Uncharacterized protein n=1 Tax=Ceratodon purpureus TaxID=3225 RepID=A0A8T0HUA8_CERPU|nr:hypothetical protein KC19_VG258700 [Ceratodon purpureus]
MRQRDDSTVPKADELGPVLSKRYQMDSEHTALCPEALIPDKLPARSLLPQLGRALVNSSQEFVTPEGHCDQETTPLWRTIQALQYHRHLHEQTLDVVVCGAFTGLTTSMIPVELQSCVPLFFFFFFGREIVYYHVFWTVLI